MSYVEVDTSLPLAINVIDGMFAYQKAIGGYRILGSDIDDTNMDYVLKNIRTAVRILQSGENPLSRFWRVWPWMFRIVNPKVPKFHMSHQFPMLSPPLAETEAGKSKHIPKFIYSQPIRSTMSEKIRGTQWNSMVSLVNADAAWMVKHDVLKVFDTHGNWGNKAMLNLSKELQAGKKLFSSEGPTDTVSFKQTLKTLYTQRPEIVVMMLYARFMPNFLMTKLPGIKTVQMFNLILCSESLKDNPYSILRAGLPAIHKLYRVPYPSSDLLAEELPDVVVPENIKKMEKRTEMPNADELKSFF